MAINQEQQADQADNNQKQVEIDKMLKQHILGSMGVGLIPVPLVDLVALTGIQINMLRKLSAFYNVSFSKDIVKNILGSVIGGGLPITLSGIFSSLIKIIPVIGPTTSALTMPVLAGATTYAVGKVFTQHFASGGTFLNFDPHEVKEYYSQMLKEGKEVASNIKKEETVSKK